MFFFNMVDSLMFSLLLSLKSCRWVGGGGRHVQIPISILGFVSLDFGAWTLDWDLDSGMSINYMFVEIHNSGRYFCLQHLLPQAEPK